MTGCGSVEEKPAEGETEWPPLNEFIEFAYDDPDSGGTCIGYWNGRHYVCGLGCGMWSPEYVTAWEPVRLVPASAAAGEVRVEWGVRWSSESTWGYGEDRQAAETAIREELTHPNWASRPTLLTRQVTTSPWVPVSDDQPKEQNR